MSRFAENGSHLAATGAAEGHAGQVGGPGSSGNSRIGPHLAVAPVTDAPGVRVGGLGSSEFTKKGSHLAGADVAEGLAGGVPPGVNESGQVGRWDFGKGKARAAFPVRLGRW